MEWKALSMSGSFISSLDCDWLIRSGFRKLCRREGTVDWPYNFDILLRMEKVLYGSNSLSPVSVRLLHTHTHKLQRSVSLAAGTRKKYRQWPSSVPVSRGAEHSLGRQTANNPALSLAPSLPLGNQRQEKGMRRHQIVIIQLCETTRITKKFLNSEK